MAPVRRSLVLMGRALFTTFSALSAPLWMLIGLTAAVAVFGRISIAPAVAYRRRRIGTVGWYDADRGYGFLIDDATGDQIFLHSSHLGRLPAPPASGDRVTFKLVTGENRPFARNLQTGERQL